MGVNEEFDAYRETCRDKKSLDRAYFKNFEYYLPREKDNLISTMQTHKEHDDLINSCAQILADTELSQNSGYKFYFTDPLIEKAEDEIGNRVFDLLFYNNRENSLILVECKTSVEGKPKKIFSQLSEQIENIERNIGYLEEQIDDKIDSEKIEYVVLTPRVYCEKIEEALKNQEKEPLSERSIKNPEAIKVWNHLRSEGKIQMQIHSKHHNKELMDALHRGVPIITHLNSKFDIPITKESHPYRIIEYILLENRYNRRVEEDIENRKIFRESEFVEEMEQRLILGVNKDEKRQIVEQKVRKIISHGLEYNIFESIDTIEGKYRIMCKGEKLNTIKFNLFEKYHENWATKKAGENAKKQTMVEHRSKIKKITDYFENER